MTVRDDIAAVLANGALTENQKKRQIRRLRAQALHGALPALPFTFTPGPLTITVESASFDNVNDLIEVVLSASITATGQVINLDNPFRFVNPPTHVPDPAGDYVREVRDRTGALIKTETFSEAPLQALRAIIVDAVRAQVPA